MNKIKIASSWSGHDCSFSIMEDGKPIIHCELERFLRLKEPQGDGNKLLFDHYKDTQDIKHYATVYPLIKTTQYQESWEKMMDIIKNNNGQVHFVGHHKSHCANAFYSSNFDEAIVISFDGGGVEDEDGSVTACSIYHGKENKLEHVETFDINSINIGGLWTRIVRYIGHMDTGFPKGSATGSWMSLASYGDQTKYKADFLNMLTKDLRQASMKPANQPIGEYNKEKEVKHPYLDKWAEIALKDEQAKYDMASSLQSATEDVIRQIVDHAIGKIPNVKNICLSGGVALNCSAMGKIPIWFPEIGSNIYIPPIPGDAGLTLGASQYVHHHILNNPKIIWNKCFTPFLGKNYSKTELLNDIQKYDNQIVSKYATDGDVVGLLQNQKIISVFFNRAESGKRALGARSIICDPRNANMKDIINQKIKHRQWYRPSSPSILDEDVEIFFKYKIDNPYMSFAIPFKEDMKNKVPAVVHKDGTGRFQTVYREINSWYYDFLKLWKEKTGLSVMLSTSFNNCEPICETADDAIKTFLGTKLDYLYFPELKMLISKNES